MSNPCESVMLDAPVEVVDEDLTLSHAKPEAPSRERRFDENSIRLMENWIVALVTLVSAGVIVATLWSHRDQARTSGPSSQVASGAGAIPR